VGGRGLREWEVRALSGEVMELLLQSTVFLGEGRAFLGDSGELL